MDYSTDKDFFDRITAEMTDLVRNNFGRQKLEGMYGEMLAKALTSILNAAHYNKNKTTVVDLTDRVSEMYDYTQKEIRQQIDKVLLELSRRGFSYNYDEKTDTLEVGFISKVAE